MNKLNDKNLIIYKDLDINENYEFNKIQLKKVNGNIYIEWCYNLEEIDIWEVNWDLDVNETLLEKVKINKIDWDLYLSGEENLEEVEIWEVNWDLLLSYTPVKKLQVEKINWNLEIIWTSENFKKTVKEQIKKWVLKIQWEIKF